ncbi:MAG: MASE3 domain-containing protein [Chitinispirillaceae bacterium]
MNKNPLSAAVLALITISAAAVLYWVSSFNFLLFHSLVESSSVIIAFGIFIVTWHTRKVTSNHFYLILGIGYLFVGLLDFFHLLAYQGMGVFPQFSLNEPAQLWIAARCLETLTILISTFFIRKRPFKPAYFLAAYSLLFVIIFSSITYFRIFPDSYTSEGLTTFKISTEYVLSVLLLLGIYRLYQFRAYFQHSILKLMSISLFASALSELSFTLYTDPYGLMNVVGHVLKIVSFALVYRAIIAIRLEEPYSSLFNEFRRSQQELLDSRRMLESRVQQRTVQLEATNEELVKQVRERVEQGRALRESEERFRVALKNSRIVMAHCDKNLRYTWIHSDYPDFGNENFIGKNDLELGDQEIYKDLWAIKAEVMKNGAGVVREVCLRRNKTSTFFEVTAEPLVDTEGKIEGVTIALLDITERKKIDERLRIRHNTLEAVYAIATTFSSSGNTLYDQIVLSIASVLKSQFVAVGRICGDRVESVSLYYDGEFHHGKSYKLECSPCKEVYKTRETVQLRGDQKNLDPLFTCFLKSESKSYLGVPVMNSEGEVLGFICVMDKEEKTFASEEVHAVEIFAAYVAQEFDRDRVQKESLHSREMQLLGRLTSGVAHEVRNPLNALMAVTEALFQDLGENEEFLIYKEHISSQVERLSRLMQDLLEMGKPFDESRRALINCSHLIKATAGLWKTSARRTHTLRTVFEEGTERAGISGDYTKLQQVLINLLDNASQHSPAQTEIAIHLAICSHQRLSIRITDQGSGVDENELKRIFEPFYTTRKKGTGLGLSIVKQIVEFHGGEIEIYNNDPLEGLTVSLCFPLKECVDDSKEQRMTQEHA